MGYVQHHAVVITIELEEHVIPIWRKAKELLGTLVSEIVVSLANDYYSFFIAPDGSKEGWHTSSERDYEREEFLVWLRSYGHCNYVFLTYGGDYHGASIQHHDHS